MNLRNIWYQTVPKQSNLVNTIGKNKTKISPEVWSKCATSVKKDKKLNQHLIDNKGSKFTPVNIFMINILDLF